MRLFFTILFLSATLSPFCQSTADKYLHYRTDYYWDSTLYKSELKQYVELKNGFIVSHTYPVLHYVMTNIVSEEPWVTVDSFEKRSWSDHPYKYIKKGNRIYLQYFDLQKRKLRLNQEYSLAYGDTVKGLAEKNTLDSKDGISVGGYSVYLGEEVITINGKEFKTFRFREDHYRPSSHPGYYTVEVFIDQATLIPVKYIHTNFDFWTTEKLLYSSITELNSSGNTLPDYTNTKATDLVVYENKDTRWTEKQKQVFLATFPAYEKDFAECLLKKLDGTVCFYYYTQDHYFRRLVAQDKCE